MILGDDHSEYIGNSEILEVIWSFIQDLQIIALIAQYSLVGM